MSRETTGSLSHVSRMGPTNSNDHGYHLMGDGRSVSNKSHKNVGIDPKSRDGNECLSRGSRSTLAYQKGAPFQMYVSDALGQTTALSVQQVDQTFSRSNTNIGGASNRVAMNVSAVPIRSMQALEPLKGQRASVLNISQRNRDIVISTPMNQMIKSTSVIDESQRASKRVPVLPIKDLDRTLRER